MPCCAPSTYQHFYDLWWGAYHRHFAMLIFLIYLVIGAIIFGFLEGGEPPSMPDPELETVIIDMESGGDLNMTLLQVTVISVDPLPGQTRFAKILYHYVVENVLESNHDSTKWGFFGALFFSMTAASTIGFGDLYPTTNAGRLVIALYASIGIPLYQIGVEHCRNLIVWTALALERGTGCRKRDPALDESRPPSSLSDVPGSNRFDAVKYFSKACFQPPFRWGIIAILFVGCCAFAFLPAIMFAILEGWPIVSAVYFNFITLTTIGFGDLIASNNAGKPGALYDPGWQNAAYKLFLIVWLMLGIAYADFILQMSRVQMERFMKIGTDFCFRRNKTMPVQRSISSVSTIEDKRYDMFRIQDLENEPDDIGDNHYDTMARRMNSKI